MGRRCGTDGKLPFALRRYPQAGTDRAPFLLGPPAWSPLWTRHVRSWCDLHSPLPGNALPEGSQRVGMDPRDQARWLPAHCPGRTSQSRGPPDSAETAQAFPRTVYLESCYGTQCSPRSLFSHSIILAAYALAKTPAGDRVNVRNALP
jgi:hypothetical protein